MKSLMSLLAAILLFGIAIAHHFQYIKGADNLGAVLFYAAFGTIFFIIAIKTKGNNNA